jgi:hypothetical protein
MLKKCFNKGREKKRILSRVADPDPDPYPDVRDRLQFRIRIINYVLSHMKQF